MSGVRFDPEAIRALAQILRDTDLTEIEVAEQDSRIRVVRAPAVVAAPAPAAAAPAPVAAVVAAPPGDALLDHPGLVTSPMVGIAYLAPEPGAAAFAPIGSPVTRGQTLLLIEAMKTFNQVRSPRDGTLARILVETGEPVEFGAPLMVIE